MTLHANQKKVAIITGSSSGIGLEIALTLANVLKDAKREKNSPIDILQLDVSDDNSITSNFLHSKKRGSNQSC
jgi:NAD(P)-dependent dehydrogenase (short-subunit alcohol dehydrogenase family)